MNWVLNLIIAIVILLALGFPFFAEMGLWINTIIVALGVIVAIMLYKLNAKRRATSNGIEAGGNISVTGESQITSDGSMSSDGHIKVVESSSVVVTDGIRTAGNLDVKDNSNITNKSSDS